MAWEAPAQAAAAPPQAVVCAGPLQGPEGPMPPSPGAVQAALPGLQLAFALSSFHLQEPLAVARQGPQHPEAADSMGHAASRPLSSTLASERPQPKRRKKSGTQRQSAFQPVQGRHGETRAFVPRQGPLNLPPPDLPPPDPQPPSNFMFCPECCPGFCTSYARPEQGHLPATNAAAATTAAASLQAAPMQLTQLQAAQLQATQLQAAQMQVAQLQAASLQLAHMQAAPLQVAQLQVAQLRIAPLQATLLPCWVPQAFLPLPEPRLRPVPQAPCFSQPVQPARAPRPPRMRVLAPPSSSQARGSSSPPPP